MKWFIVAVVFDGMASSGHLAATREKAEKIFESRTGYTLEHVNEALPDSEAGHFQGSEIFEVRALSSTPSRKVSYQIVVPTEDGEDLHSQDDKLDAHIRLETLKSSRPPGTFDTRIFVDLFLSPVGDPNQAHVTTQDFPRTKQGAMEATDFLLENNFKVHVTLE